MTVAFLSRLASLTQTRVQCRIAGAGVGAVLRGVSGVMVVFTTSARHSLFANQPVPVPQNHEATFSCPLL